MLSHVPLRVSVVPEHVVAAPGSAVAMSVTVFNATSIIDGFKVSLIGVNQDDVTVEPDWVSLFPESEQTVAVAVQLPTDFPSGEHHLGVKVTSMTDDTVVWVGGIDVTVTEREAAEIVIDPESATATKAGRFGLVVANTGNRILNFGFAGDDAENLMAYSFEPNALELPPGESASVQMVVTGDRPFTGSPAARPFTVIAKASEQELIIGGILTLKPRIPRLALILAGMALMFGLWALVIGGAIDTIVDDQDADLSEAFEEGMESVVGAVAPDALAGDAAATGGGVAGAVDADGGAAGADAGAGDPVTILESTVTAPVVSESNAQPLPGATATLVSLFDAGSREGQVDPNREPIEVVSNDVGVFIAEDVPRGLYRLTVGSTGYTSTDCEIMVPFDTSSISACGTTPSATTGDEAIAILGLTASISGLVTIEGDPAPDATVTIQRLRETDGMSIDAQGKPADQFADPITTSSDGRWTFGVPAGPPGSATPGVFEIEASKSGFVTNRAVLDLGAGQHLLGIELPLAVAVVGNGVLTGSITNTGTPLGGVTITVTGDGASAMGTSLSTAAEGKSVGSFEIRRLPVGDLVATFQKDGYLTNALSFSITDETPTATLTVVMIPIAGGTVSGTVTDQDGNPLGGVLVTVSGTNVSLTTATLTTGDPATGRGPGTFALDGLEAGSLTATFQFEGFVTQSRAFSITDTNHDATVDAELVPIHFGSLGGTVTRPDGSALVGATITVDGPDGLAATTSVFKTNGSYSITSLPEGAYTATFSAATFVSETLPFSISTAQPAKTLSLEMTYQPVPLTGLVVGLDADGETSALPGASVIIKGKTVGGSTADGTFSTTPQVIPGTYDLTFTAPGHATVTTSITVDDPFTAALTAPVTMPALADITIDILDESDNAPFPLPLFDETGNATVDEPTVTLTITSYTEPNVEFATPVEATVTDSTITLESVPVIGTIKTEMLVTPAPGSTFVPYESGLTKTTIELDPSTAPDPIVVFFAPGAIYGSRGQCNLSGSSTSIELGSSAAPDLLTKNRYLYSGMISGTFSLEVVEDFGEGTVTLYQEDVTIDGSTPATKVNLGSYCNTITPG